MDKISLKQIMIGFIIGVAAALITGLFSLRISNMEKEREQKLIENQNIEHLAVQLSELDSFYKKYKNNLIDKSDCELAYQNLNDISSQSIKIMGNATLDEEFRKLLIDYNIKLEFVTYNYCKILKTHGEAPPYAIVNGKRIDGFLFAANLEEVESIMAVFLSKIVNRNIESIEK